MPLDVFDPAILILAHFEKIVVFADAFDWPFAVRAQPLSHILLRPESLIKCAIPSSVVSLVNQLVIVKLLKP